MTGRPVVPSAQLMFKQLPFRTRTRGEAAEPSKLGAATPSRRDEVGSSAAAEAETYQLQLEV